MDENLIAKQIVDASFQIHKGAGPGLFESVYEKLLDYELDRRGLSVERQVPIPVIYKGVKIDQGFRADLLIEGKVIVEVKSTKAVHPVHKKQLLTYLRFADLRLGLLINFGEELIRNGITRIVNGLY